MLRTLTENLHLRPHEQAGIELAAEGGPLLHGDWRDALMVHFAIDAEELQPHTPFPLDLFEGRAIITLVAFRMERLRLTAWPRAPGWLMQFGGHAFLNVRTYVRINGERGIFFLNEYVPKLLARMMGPATYGLPYRFTRMHYEHEPRNRRFTGRLGWQKNIEMEADYALAPELTQPGTFEEFVLERYNAFTRRWGRAFRFRVEHPPWRMRRARLLRWKDELLRADHAFWARTRYVGAHFTTGFRDVAMGAPQPINT